MLQGGPGSRVLPGSAPDATPGRWSRCPQASTFSPPQMRTSSPSRTSVCDVKAAGWYGRPVKTARMQESQRASSAAKDTAGWGRLPRTPGIGTRPSTWTLVAVPARLDVFHAPDAHIVALQDLGV
ncbi:hypothetical protein MRX96_010101 [Rhipicephalus microplus]